MIAYVLETIVCSALFLALYRLLVAGKVAPLPSRIFLAVTMILSAVIPTLNLPILPAKAQYVQIPVTAATAESLSAAADSPDSVSVWQVAVIAIYIVVTLIFLALLCRDLVKIARLRRKGTISRKSGYTLVENDAVASPFTFWRTVFIGDGMEPREREVVLAHESSHARHLHTVDKLLLSLLRAVYWFNPFYWMALSSLAQLQEWEADRDTLEGGVDLQTFRMTIFKQMFGYYPDLSSALIQGPVKKRFAMMVGGIKSRRPALRLGAALPLAALLVVMFGAAARPASQQAQDGGPASVRRITIVEVDSTGSNRRIVDIKAVTETDTIVGVANHSDSTVSIVANKDSVVSYIVNGKEIPVERIIRIDKSTAPTASVRKKDSATVIDLNKEDSKKFINQFGAKNRDIKKGELSKLKIIAAEEEAIDAIPYALVDQKPRFQGGNAGTFSQWVNQHLRYPYDAHKNGIQGRVTLQFSVGTDGTVSEVKVLRGADPSLDKEAVRVVSSSPKWTPGKHNDKPVKVTFTFPVIFRLKDDTRKDTINDAVIVVRGDDSDTKYTVNGVVVPKDSLIRIDKSKIESVSVNKEKNTILIILKD